MKLDDDLGGRAIQVRVTQGNEPRHFLRMFKGISPDNLMNPTAFDARIVP